MKKLIFLLLVSLPALGQSNTYNATAYGSWVSKVTSVNSGFIGAVPAAFNTDASITLNRNGANQETVTPSAVANCFPGSITCTLTVTLSNQHVAGETIQSGTFGLQEAINAATTAGAGTVLVDATWQGPSGSSLITTAAGSIRVIIQDNRTGVPQFYQWNGSAYTNAGGGGAPTTCSAGTYACIASANTFTAAQQAPVLNGVTNATLAAGSDIGARVNAAFQTLVSGSRYGVVIIDPTQATNGTYAQTTTITVPRGDVLDCQGATLFWNASSGTAAIFGDATTNYVSGGFRRCNFSSGGGTQTAIYAGGDPNGVISPSANYGNFMFIEDSSIFGFATGYTHGSNVWANKIDNTLFFGNTNHILSAPTNSINEGEATIVTHSKIFNATNCGFSLSNTDDVYYVTGGSIDYNANGGVCGTGAAITLHDVWEEQLLGPFINITGSSSLNVVRVNGGTATQGANTGTAADLWHVEGAFGSYVNIQDVTVQTNGSLYTLGVGVGSGTNVRVCVANTSGIHQFLAVPTNIIEGCTYSVPFRIQFDNSIASFSPDPSGLQTAGQGWNLQWNVQLAGLTGETDFVNVRGTGTGGWVWCDGSNTFVPSSTCTSTATQMYLNGTTGELYLPKSMAASELVFTDTNKGLISGTALPAGTTATTPGNGDNSTLVATTAWVNTYTSASYAPLASPTFTGTPAAPTATAGTNNTQLATTAYATSAIATAIAALNFSNLPGGTNTTGTFTCGTGCTITFSGSGGINASALGSASASSYARLNAAQTTTAAQTNSTAGAASTPAQSYTGAPNTGSATTSFPLVYINDGAAVTTFSTSGTEFGINAPSAFAGNFLDFHLNGGASLASLSNTGSLTLAGSLFAGSSSFTSIKSNSGATFSASGCSVGTLTGNSTSGTFASGTTGTCTVTVTMGASQSAAKDWSCMVRDTTTPADTIVQSGAVSTTQATFTGTTVSGDVISFACIGHG